MRTAGAFSSRIDRLRNSHDEPACSGAIDEIVVDGEDADEAHLATSARRGAGAASSVRADRGRPRAARSAGGA